MGTKTQIALVATVMAMLFGSVGAYAVDAAGKDKIAEGVTIGGVEVGGMEVDEARAAVTRRLLKPLDKPLEVSWREKHYKLNTDRLGLRANVSGMVDEALRVSQDGGLPGRLWRRISGEEVSHEVDFQIAYSKSGVEEYIETIAADIERDPANASVEPTSSSLAPVPGRFGYEIDSNGLRKRIESKLTSQSGSRELALDVKRIRPEATTADLADQYPTYVLVDRGNFKLRLYKNLELAREYTVAIGAIGYATPAGLYSLQSKQVDPVWNVPNSDWAGKLAGQTIPPGPDNPLKARWMGIFNGAGIHGTSDIGSLGSAASHGCVRMAVPDVIDLFDRVEVGTPVYIG